MREFNHKQRIGVVRSHIAKREPNPSCKTGGFYKNPTAGATIDVDSPLKIEWDTTCLDIERADIYLYAPGSNKTLAAFWGNVIFKSGSFETRLKPSWWGSTQSQSLQFAILEKDGSAFMNEYPAGPIFTAKYNKQADTVVGNAETTNTETGYTILKEEEPKSLTSGKIAVGVLIPLIFIGLAVFAWLRFKRRKGKEERKRFSEAIDKRMSIISTDWKSVSAAGASAAIRHSMAQSADSPNGRTSFAIRPQSSVTTFESNQAGVGARKLYNLDSENGSRMSQARISRVSFADQPRPSLESRRAAGTSRAFHSGYIPPVPTRKDSSNSDESVMSPTQAQGALPLSNTDIDVLPALSMMHTDGGNDMLLRPSTPPTPLTPPSPAHPKSLFVGMMPMPTVGVMSPDEMLRAYAERRSVTPSSTSAASASISYPAPALGTNGMRALYSTPTPVARKSVAPTVGSNYSNDDESFDDAYGAIAK